MNLQQAVKMAWKSIWGKKGRSALTILGICAEGDSRQQVLDALGVKELTPDALRQTAGFVLKNSEDLQTAQEVLGERNCHCEGHGHG